MIWFLYGIKSYETIEGYTAQKIKNDGIIMEKSIFFIEYIYVLNFSLKLNICFKLRTVVNKGIFLKTKNYLEKHM